MKIENRYLIITDRIFVAEETLPDALGRLSVSDEARVKNGELQEYLDFNMSFNESSVEHSQFKYVKMKLNFSDAEKLANWITTTLANHHYFKEKKNV